jgi:hypothetical protein
VLHANAAFQRISVNSVVEFARMLYLQLTGGNRNLQSRFACIQYNNICKSIPNIA